MQILPTFDIGQALGQGLGTGFSDIAGQATQRQLLKSGLSALDQLNLDEASPLDVVKEVTGALAGIRGGPQIAESVLPILLQRQKALGQARGIKRPGVGKSPERPSDLREDRAIETQPGITDDRPYADLPEQRGGDVHDLKRADREYFSPIQKQKINDVYSGFVKELNETEMLPEGTLSVSPQFSSLKPAYDVPNIDDFQERVIDIVETANVPFDKAVETARTELELKKERYQSQVDEYNRRLKEHSEARGLEDSQKLFLSGGETTQGKVTGWIKEKNQPDSQFWHDVSYRFFDSARSKNPKDTDQQIWNKVKPQLDTLLDLEEKSKNVKPWVIQPRQVQKTAIQNAKSYSNKFYELAGKTPETIERVRSNLMEQGWERPLAYEAAMPLTQRLKPEFEKFPRIGKSGAAFALSPESAAALGRKRRGEIDRLYPDFEKLAENFTNEDSPYVLRNKLVYEKNLTPLEANEFIEYLRKNKGFTGLQEGDAQLIQKRMPSILMYNIFQEGLE
jgi:hypothetical protein